MTRLLLALAGIVPALAGAAGFSFTARMDEAWDKHEFELEATGGNAKLFFSLPPGSGIHVTAVRDTVTALDARITMSSPLTLRGSGRYKVTVQRDSGSGELACRDALGTASLRSLSSFADTTFAPRITISTEDDEANWKFTWPRSSTFMVQTIGPGGKIVDEMDLYDEDNYELFGPGSAALVIKVTDGGGAYSLRLVE
jgi:hypothetical protein